MKYLMLSNFVLWQEPETHPVDAAQERANSDSLDFNFSLQTDYSG